MTIEFNIREAQPTTYDVFCCRNEALVASDANRDVAAAAWQAHLEASGHQGCSGVSPQFPYPDVAVTGSSLGLLAELVGFDYDRRDSSGSMPGAEFHAKVVAAQQKLPAYDPDRTPAAFARDKTAYAVCRLHDLEQVGAYAKDHAMTVVWS